MYRFCLIIANEIRPINEFYEYFNNITNSLFKSIRRGRGNNAVRDLTEHIYGGFGGALSWTDTIVNGKD